MMRKSLQVILSTSQDGQIYKTTANLNEYGTHTAQSNYKRFINHNIQRSNLKFIAKVIHSINTISNYIIQPAEKKEHRIR
jgi:hypothetical protein